jgi:1-deoxy-D-xylulose-5-phosphate synthase
MSTVENLLSRTEFPPDLKKLTIPQLVKLAHEIRARIIEVVSKNGGHLAPSLGCVELAIAIHYVFDTPRDKIIWDVGHQSYAHKILTGRNRNFDKLRQYGGISGFPRREESPYDTFNAGHSSTSISAAVGMVCARDLLKEDYHVVAVIGDGALSAGLAYEGLNNAGAMNRNLIVILNDNEMSISKNVGAMSCYLTDIITNPLYNRIKTDVWEFTGKLPSVGGTVRKLAHRIQESLKSLIVNGMLFEELGFRYFGPVDGHNLASLIKTLKNVKTTPGSILVHILSKKGKGFTFTEKNPCKYHGIGAFNPKTGKLLKKKRSPTYSSIFGDTLTDLAEKHSNIVAITAAMTEGTGLPSFRSKYPRRFFDVGIAEQHAVTFAAGMAAQGLKPVVAIYSTFLQRAYDQVIHDVCIPNLPVFFALDRAGLVGEDGPTHHGSFDLSYLRIIPNLVLMAPKDENEFRDMLFTGVQFEKGPIAVRYPRGSGAGAKWNGEYHPLEIGRGEVIQDGEDVTFIAVGLMVQKAVKIAKTLEAEGVSAAVINARFIKPLDEELILRYAGKTGRLFLLEENARSGGFGSAVLELLNRQQCMDTAVRIFGLPDRFVTHGKIPLLHEEVGLDVESILRELRTLDLPLAKSITENRK